MSVDSLLNFNGVDGTQVFTDDGLVPAVWTVSSGTPVLSTTEKKFGLSSLYLDGNVNAKGLQVSGVNFGDTNSSYTMEGWFRTSSVAIDYQGLLTNNPTSVGIYLRFDNLIWYQAGDKILNNFTIVVNTWYHFAFIRNLHTVWLYINGVSLGSTDCLIDDSVSGLLLGSQNTIPSYPLIGYIDDFRYTPDEILYNILSNLNNIPTTELTTATVQPPVLPTDHSIITPNLPSSPTGLYLGSQSNHTIIGGGSGGVTPDPDPTTTNIISGNVKKLGLPFGTRVAVVNTGINPSVVGSGLSDEITGDYSIDVHPETNECLIYIAPDYGLEFIPDSTVSLDQIIHPTVPNRYVYICTVAGTVGNTEPNWGTEGLINSGGATFNTIPLHRPLMNGFIKPVVTPI